MSTCDEAKDHNNEIHSDESCLNIKCRQSFFPTDESNSEGGRNRGEDNNSTSTEYTIAESVKLPMSINESSTGDDSIKERTDKTTPTKQANVNQLPQGCMQPDGSQVYQPVMYPQQYQAGFNAYPGSRGDSVGYLPGVWLPMPMNSPSPQLSQPQQVYPFQQYQAALQNWVPITPSNTGVPSMTRSSSWPQTPHFQAQQTPIVTSSMANTPVFSCLSSPGYANTYSCVQTPLISPAPCTPHQCYLRCPDVPPRLDLVDDSQGCNYPQKISCNISLGCRSVSETPTAPFETPQESPKNQPKSSTNAVSLRKRREKNLWQGNLTYAEYNYNGGSNLFITWSGTKADLVEKFHQFSLDVRDIFSTSDEKICNVIFESHPIARKAFTMQNQIRLRIVPPISSNRIWLRNPSPKFLVKFETKRSLTVRRGRAECHDIVGEILQGCMISVDQLKGHRIRVLWSEGNFRFPGGKTVNMTGVPDNCNEKTPLGWVSYRCKYTNELNVIRRTWNLLSDYIYEA